MNEQITREAMKKEAERRIKMLNLHPNAVQEFIEEGRLNRSDRTRIVSPVRQTHDRCAVLAQ